MSVYYREHALRNRRFKIQKTIVHFKHDNKNKKVSSVPVIRYGDPDTVDKTHYNDNNNAKQH